MAKVFYKFIRKKKWFTLIELMVVLALFVVIFAIVTRFYNTAHKVTSSASKHAMIFENAKIALDLMSRELQCIYYENGKTPFWHWRPEDPANPPSWGNRRNEFLAFVSVTNLPQNNKATSKISEIKYQKIYRSNLNKPDAGWLMRSVTSNKLSNGTNNPKWNYYDNLIVGYTTTLMSGTPVAAFTANSTSNHAYQKVIPYVTDLSFTCFDKDGIVIQPDHGDSTASDSGTLTGFPFSIEIMLSLMDKNSWLKWISIDDTAGNGETTEAQNFRRQYERTFRKTVLIGNRGQYD